jgi:hypothetical protein
MPFTKPLSINTTRKNTFHFNIAVIQFAREIIIFTGANGSGIGNNPDLFLKHL